MFDLAQLADFFRLPYESIFLRMNQIQFKSFGSERAW